ncbi:hypothetical protein ACHAXR_002127 [Thalassiosira sp. AJA248-18]
MILSQYLCDRGIHIGLECQAGLVSNSRTYLKYLTAKGINNHLQGFLSESSIMEHGELQHVVPHNCISIHANIYDLVDVGNFDFILGFDDVFEPETFHKMGEVWNHPKSKMCKVFVTNLTPSNIEECGFQDIVLKDTVQCKLARTGDITEYRTFYVYLRGRHSLPGPRVGGPLNTRNR